MHAPSLWPIPHRRAPSSPSRSPAGPRPSRMAPLPGSPGRSTPAPRRPPPWPECGEPNAPCTHARTPMNAAWTKGTDAEAHRRSRPNPSRDLRYKSRIASPLLPISHPPLPCFPPSSRHHSGILHILLLLRDAGCRSSCTPPAFFSPSRSCSLPRQAASPQPRAAVAARPRRRGQGPTKSPDIGHHLASVYIVITRLGFLFAPLRCELLDPRHRPSS